MLRVCLIPLDCEFCPYIVAKLTWEDEANGEFEDLPHYCRRMERLRILRELLSLRPLRVLELGL